MAISFRHPHGSFTPFRRSGADRSPWFPATGAVRQGERSTGSSRRWNGGNHNTGRRAIVGLALLALVVAGVALGGCTPIDGGLGETVRHNAALQTLDPDPQYAGDLYEGGSGERAALAQKRYREGKVIEPVQMRTTSIAVGGGGSGGGGSGSK
jgi:hypothetical protein